METDYKEALSREFGIVFNQLFAITNQPIARFAEGLRQHGQWDEYLELLANNFNPATVEGLMCRSTISVGWMGEVFDCDFNQMIRKCRCAMANHSTSGTSNPRHLEGWVIQTGAHCLACTAGCGSSCTGAVAYPTSVCKPSRKN